MLLKAKMLISFLALNVQVVCSGWVFIQLLGDCVAKFSLTAQISVKEFLEKFVTISPKGTIFYQI